MIESLVAFVWLLLVWMTLLGTTSPGGILMGAVLGAGLLWYFRPTRDREVVDPLAFRPLHAITFAAYFLVQFIDANIKVALAVIQPSRVREARAIIGVPIVAASETSSMLLANAITLTPGTFFLELQRQPAMMYVHVLQLSTVRDARLSVLEMERRILLAIGPAGSAEQAEILKARVAAGEFDDDGRAA